MLFSANSIVAQFDFGLSVGAKGGFAPTKAVKPTAPLLIFSDSGGEYLVGPTVELRLPLGFAAEVDALYHHADYGGGLTQGGIYGKASTWEVPYLAKFRFPIPLLKPFVLAGGTFRVPAPSTVDAGMSKNGFVTGVGLELRVMRFRTSVEGRYIRWGESKSFVVNYPQDQTEVLFGFTF